MRLLILFLCAAFVVGGSSIGPRLQRRPIFVLLGTLFVGTMYYSYRFVA